MSGFSEDQLKKLKDLNRKYALKGFGMIAKCFGLLLLANFLVCFADLAYVHSKAFVFLASFLSGFLFSTSAKKASSAGRLACISENNAILILFYV